MKRWACLVVLLFVSPAFADWKGDLERGDEAAALEHSRSLSVRSPQWGDRLESFTRFELAKGSPLEAWRLVQLARRTGAAKSAKVWNDYERLAVFRLRACALEIEEGDAARARLLRAASFRILGSMFRDDPAPIDDLDGSHLSVGLVPYLAEIPHAELIAGRGCRAQKIIYRKKSLEAIELEDLLAYLESRTPDLTSEGDFFVRLRILALSQRLQPKTYARVLQDLAATPLKLPWNAVEDGEKHWLFLRLFASTSEAIAPEKREVARKIALEAFQRDFSVRSIGWLGVVDLPHLPARERVQLLIFAEKRGTFEGRGSVLLEIAALRAELGETNEALTVLRRLLVEKEAPLTEEEEAAAVRLAATLFGEYRFDEHFVGAIQAAVPTRLWLNFIAEAETMAALSARAREFDRLENLGHAREKKSILALKHALAHRELAGFRRSLKESFKHGGSEMLATFAGDLESHRANVAAEPGLTPFLHALAEQLREVLQSARRRGDDADHIARISDLSSLLERGDAEAAGDHDVRRGLVRLGVVHWESPTLSPKIFELQAPASLPSRELVEVPEVSGSGWRLSTAVR